MTDLPAGYKKAKVKRDEYMRPRRMALQVGRPRVCQSCYRARPQNVDHICGRCLGDLRELAELEVEIAKVIPRTSKMTRPQIFRALWKRYQELRTIVDRTLKQPARVGVR